MDTKIIAELPALGNRDTITQNSSKIGEIVKIPISKIMIREGFNVREDYGELEELAKSIEENGQVQPGRVDVTEDGYFILVDGHRRFEALKLLQTEDTIPFFLAIVNGKRTTEEQRILQMFITADSKALTAPEIAELLSRLVNIGYSQIEVAKRIGKTPAYVSQLLSFNEETPEIKKLVKDKKITVSNVLAVKKDIPNQQERTNIIKNAVNNNTTGKSVKAEEITGSNDKKINSIANELIALYGIDPDEIDTIKQIIKRNL